MKTNAFPRNRPLGPGVTSLWLLLSMGCSTEIGAAESTIINGRPATMEEVFSTVVIPVGGTDDPMDLSNCTGTLIRPNVVLSAGHCFFQDDDEGEATMTPEDLTDLTVIAGPLDVFSAQAEQRYAVTRVLVHPDYDNVDIPPFGEAASDVALVFVDRPIIQVPLSPTAMPGEPTVGTPLILGGYGASRIDDSPEMNPVDLGTLMVADVSVIRTSDTEFIAVGTGMMDSCPGDSGGPAYVRDGNSYRVVGVTSRADPESPSACGGGGIYSSVARFQDWIDMEAGPVPEMSDEGCTASGALPKSSIGLLVFALVLLKRRTDRESRT